MKSRTPYQMHEADLARGGFSVSELNTFIPGWQDELSEVSKLKAELAQAREMIRKLTAPVSDEEAEFLCCEAHDGWKWLQWELDALIAARAKENQ